MKKNPICGAKTNISFGSIVKVIDARNTLDMVDRFVEAGTDVFKKKKLWEEIPTKAEITIASTKLAEKYGKLLGEFRKHK